MRNNFKLSVTNEKGYTLVDGIIQLAVLLLFSQVFAVTIAWTNRAEEIITNPTELEWALFVQSVETYLNDLDSLVTQENQSGIRFRKNNEEYDIEFYTDLIRKQKNRLGHEQMLLHVKSMIVTVEGHSVRFFVTFFNGMEKEHTFYVTFRPE